MDELLQQIISRLRGMWHRRWIGLARRLDRRDRRHRYRLAHTREVRSQRPRLRRYAVAAAAADGRARDPAQSRSAGGADEPHADQPPERRKADPHGGYRSPREVDRGARRADRQPDEAASALRQRQDNLYVISYRDPDPEKAQERRSVAAHDIRRVEPRGQTAGHPQRDEIRRRADQALRGEPAGRGGSPQAIQAEIPGRHRTSRTGLFLQAVEIATTKSKTQDWS